MRVHSFIGCGEWGFTLLEVVVSEGSFFKQKILVSQGSLCQRLHWVRIPSSKGCGAWGFTLINVVVSEGSLCQRLWWWVKGHSSIGCGEWEFILSKKRLMSCCMRVHSFKGFGEWGFTLPKVMVREGSLFHRLWSVRSHSSITVVIEGSLFQRLRWVRVHPSKDYIEWRFTQPYVVVSEDSSSIACGA